MDTKQILINYSVGLAKAAKLLPLEQIEEAARKIKECDDDQYDITTNSSGQIFICGNGGSALTASHITLDLKKNAQKVLNVICLNDNMGLVTAYANDRSYEDIFIELFSNIAHDRSVAIFISTSGESENVVKLAKMKDQWNFYAIGLLGQNKESRLAKMVDLSIHIESDNIGIVEDLHLSIGHIWTELIRSW